MKRLLAVILSAALFVTLGVGCTPAKKPAPAPSPDTTRNTGPNTGPNRGPNAPNTDTRVTPKTTPRMTPAPARKPGMPTASADMHKLATKLADEAAKVPGVKKATVAISGTDAYVGIDIKSNVSGKTTNTIKKDVANRVDKADNRISNVYVSTDVDTVTRIKKVAQGISQGKPLSSFSAQLSEIGRRIVPKKSK